MKNVLKVILFSASLSTCIFAQANIIHDNNAYYYADRIVVKFKDNLPGGVNNLSSNKINKLEISHYELTFKPSTRNISTDIEKIHTLKFSSPYDPLYVIKEISKLKEIEWAEPYYLYELVLEPNDPNYLDGTLQHLPLIQAEQAWDINTGSEEIIIAIVDTGVDWAHPDLADNIWTNSAEIPNNGIDDDGNGFDDDYRGWDFGGLDGTPDNDPKEDKADHGTLVAGLASAVTNNGTGVASIGYKSKLMAVKTSQNDVRSDIGIALIAYGFEGVKYAADNGAHVINCSWGGYNYSNLAQEIINYATSKGALVVAAAGNDNSSKLFYPASYNGVLSVGGTSYVDQKASWSNYGTKIDVTAPGVNVYSTWQDDPFYHATSGTSLSSPIVAGLSALAYSQFPNYNPLQIAEQIRINCDNIDDINPNYTYLLGSGRINAYKTLSNTNSKSVRISNVSFIEVGDGDGIFESGENVKISPIFTNYLNPISNLTLFISIDNNNATVVKNGGTIGALNTLEVIDAGPNIFEIEISPTAEENLDLNILLSYSDSDYNDFEWIVLNINPTYQIQTTDNLSLTFNSAGSMGFDDYPTNLKGDGLTYKDGPNLMFEGALIYGTSVKTITNVARSTDGNQKDQDFRIINPITLNIPGEFTDKEIYAKFDDSASTNGLEIETELFTYSFSEELDADYIFIRYVFLNKTNTAIQNFYAGQYWDFDLDENSYDDDIAAYDFDNNFGYVYDDNGSPIKTHIGLALLSSNQYGFMVMDEEGTNASVISQNGFTDEEKWTSLSSGLEYASAGPSDISVLISGGPFNLEPNKKFVVDFLIAAAESIEKLKNTVLQSKSNYLELLKKIEQGGNSELYSFKLIQNFPNPFNQSTKIQYSLPYSLTQNEIDESHVTLKVFDILGRQVATLINEKQKPGNYEVIWNAVNQSSGVYFYKLVTDNFVKTKKMILLK